MVSLSMPDTYTQILQSSQGCISRILQHLTAKLRNFINFKTLFLAVLI